MGGLEEIIKRSVLSVFNEINLSSEAWFEKSKLLTLGRRNYASYIIRSLGQFSLFGTSRSASVTEVYVRVNITTDLERERYKDPEEIQRSLMRQTKGEAVRNACASLPIDAIESTKTNFALLGNPGSGKTTAFRHLAVEIAKGRPIRGKRRIAAYFAVRDMAAEKLGILKAATRFLRLLGIAESRRVLLALLESGALVLLLDGLDETDQDHQRRLLRDLDVLRSRYPDTVLCVSARPYSLSVAVPGYTKWETLPLNLEERTRFVEKWFHGVDPDKGNRLLNESKARPELLDLGSSPLLLSIVCALYYNELNIPSDPDELYAQAVEGLLGRWDAFRSIARETVLSKLSVRRRVNLLSWIAASLFESGKIVFSVRDVERLECVERAVKAMRTEPIEVDALLRSLYNDFGILVERAPGLYSFSHLTLHEYLAALFVIDNRRETAFLNRHRNDQAFFEVLRLIGKMLPNSYDFMANLTTHAAFEDVYQTSLLRAAWATRPVCSESAMKQLMTYVAGRISRIALDNAVHIEYEDGGLMVMVLPKARAASPLVQVLENLTEILNNSGFTYNDLRFGATKRARTVRTVSRAIVRIKEEKGHQSEKEAAEPSNRTAPNQGPQADS